MATPEFILQLREKIGHDPLWLPGVTVISLRTHPARGTETLLVLTHDGRWKPVTGIIDPEENPDAAGARETLEETGVEVVADRLLAVEALPERASNNGDLCSFMDIAVAASPKDSTQEPAGGDDENADAAWFPVGDLPPLKPRYAALIHQALDPTAPARLGPAPELP